jgi:site-specific recombinase XerD
VQQSCAVGAGLRSGRESHLLERGQAIRMIQELLGHRVV